MFDRIEKSLARHITVALAPECGGILSDFHQKRDGWVKLPDILEQVRKNSGLGDSYVIAYENEARIFLSLCKAIFPENTKAEINQFDTEFQSATPEERMELFSLFQSDEFDLTLDSLLSVTEEEREKHRKEYEALSTKEQYDCILSIQFFLTFLYSHFYNNLSLMVHGQKLTTLVPLALQGNKDAFCKAVQIDRNLLTGHSYFKDTYANLQSGSDKDFLNAVLYRIGNPTIRGKIRFPALYMVFATLESFHLLDDFTASEILDICDEAKLDRFQNRIEDENYLIKRRSEYRRFQKISPMSMH